MNIFFICVFAVKYSPGKSLVRWDVPVGVSIHLYVSRKWNEVDRREG